MDLGLKDHVVLVTGGTRGIGASLVRAFAGEGARVAFTYHTGAAAAADLVEELGGPGWALALHHDLADPEAAGTLTTRVVERFGTIDAFVANAIARDAGPGADSWAAYLDANLVSVLRTTTAVSEVMGRDGGGRIVLLSSHLAEQGRAGQEMYTAAKAALLGFARSLARSRGPDRVLVNVVSPGLTLTEDARSYFPAPLLAHAAEQMPTGRLGRPDEVARFVLFYCSRANDNVSGALVSLTGRG